MPLRMRTRQRRPLMSYVHVPNGQAWSVRVSRNAPLGCGPSHRIQQRPNGRQDAGRLPESSVDDSIGCIGDRHGEPGHWSRGRLHLFVGASRSWSPDHGDGCWCGHWRGHCRSSFQPDTGRSWPGLVVVCHLGRRSRRPRLPSRTERDSDRPPHQADRRSMDWRNSWPPRRSGCPGPGPVPIRNRFAGRVHPRHLTNDRRWTVNRLLARRTGRVQLGELAP